MSDQQLSAELSSGHSENLTGIPSSGPWPALRAVLLSRLTNVRKAVGQCPDIENTGNELLVINKVTE